MTPITLNVSDELAQRLRPLENRLPQILELGLRELSASSRPGFPGASALMEFLTTLPTPDQILALCPSETLQNRVTELLEKNRATGMTPEEEEEWQEYEYLEHLVRMAKARALVKPKSG